MTKLSVHTELFHKGATYPLAGWLLPSALIVGGVLAAALIGATFGTPPSGWIGKATTAEAFVHSPRPGGVAAVEIMKIVPADASGEDLSWWHLTTDHSN